MQVYYIRFIYLNYITVTASDIPQIYFHDNAGFH